MDKLDTILYIEDEQDSQRILSKFLKRFCNNLYVANNGEEAFEIYKNHYVSLVISDIQMPKMNGIELATKIKEINSDQFIIFTTAHIDETFLYDTIKLQVNGYILKPINLRVLEKKIQELAITINWKINEKNRKEELETILETTKDGIAIIDLDRNFLYANKAFQNIFEFTKDELFKINYLSLGNKDDRRDNLMNIERAIRNGFSENFEKEYISKSGKKINTIVNTSLMPDRKRILIVLRDISERKEKQQLLDTYISIVDENVISSTTDLKGKIISVSNAFCKLCGFDKKELIGSNHNIVRDSETPKEIYEKLWSTIKKNKIWKGEVKNRKKDGSFFWVESIITPVFDSNNNKIGYTSIKHDITDKKFVENISRMDFLTEIYNRRFFNEKLLQIINSAKREQKLFSFIMMDVDFFKQYNDNYGHFLGDEVLKNIAIQLKALLKRGQDYSFRIGGEEFAITYESDNIENAKKFAELIRTSIENLKIEHKGSNISKYVTVSMGLLIIEPTKNTTFEEVYKLTDSLLYEAKDEGRNRIVSNLL